MEDTLSANPGYALAQLARALETNARHEDAATRERAARRIERWRQILEGMASGSITHGSRTPVAGAPAWATLEVATGGFATGRLLAGGPLQPHERAVEERLGLGAGVGPAASAEEPSRAALNLYYLGDEGRAELLRLLRSGCYRVQVPEEGALLVVAWLIEGGHGERAQEVIDAIVSHLDRLRFYPVPDEQPLVPSAFVKLHSAAEVADALDATRPKEQVERMNEALRIWAPLYDRAVALFLETIEGETPSLRREANGDLARRPDGQPLTEGGWPCWRYPPGWSGRAQALLDEYQAARRQHGLCGKPEDPSENFAILRQALGTCVKDPAALTGRDVGRVRKVLASFVSSHGAPGSPEHARLRGEQARVAALPTRREVAAVVSARLRRRPGDTGIESLEQVAGPLSEAELGGRAAGARVPPAIVAKLERCLEAPIEHLVARGVIPSSEVLAQVLPQITSQVKAAGVADPELARLYAAIYSAFRRRRSLLLLDLASQVRLEELPWVAALKGLRQQDVRDRARQTLTQVATLAIASFPQTILPNKLLQELRSLVQDGGDWTCPSSTSSPRTSSWASSPASSWRRRRSPQSSCAARSTRATTRSPWTACWACAT